MEFIVHRGSHEVGGSCIELFDEETRILLDLGLPLSVAAGADPQRYFPQPLFEDLIQGKKSIQGVFLSHAHPDHHGLIQMLPENIRIFCGKDTAKMIELGRLMSPNEGKPPIFQTFSQQDRISIGAFTVIPYLMDHSAFDAYAFLVENNEKKLFYTGDFRGHGRKAQLFYEFIQNPPSVDILLIEGTRIIPQSDTGFSGEQDLEEAFVRAVNKTKGIVLVTTASQNIDRLVTIFKAARRTGRMLVIDIYTAEVLDSLKDYPRIPKSWWGGVRVCLSHSIAKRLIEAGREDAIRQHREKMIRWPRINERRGKSIVLIRGSMIGPVKRFIDLEGALWVYSMWPGYLEKSESLKRLKDYLEGAGVQIKYLHTSGHASLADLKRLAHALSPKTLIPVHTFYPEIFKEYFQNVRLVSDGEIIQC
jgi:ribonuclease J